MSNVYMKVRVIIELDVSVGPWTRDSTILQAGKQSVDQARGELAKAVLVLNNNGFPGARGCDVSSPVLLVPVSEFSSK